MLVLAIAVLVATLRFSPLADMFTLESLAAIATRLRSSPTGPLWIFGGFIVAATCGVPVIGLVVATEVVLGPLAGAACALAGAVVSAAIGFGLGRLVGPQRVRALLGERGDAISRRIAKRGTLAVTVVRVLPLAPFMVVNAVAGITHIRLHQFLFGTLFGMAPGVVALGLVSQEWIELVRSPSPIVVARVVFAVFLLAALVLGVRRWAALPATGRR